MDLLLVFWLSVSLLHNRLTISAECPMKLVDFPMDGHACPLKFGSCESRTFTFILLQKKAVFTSHVPKMSNQSPSEVE